MNAKQLIEAAERVNEEWNVNRISSEDLQAVINHVMATVRLDDDEPVTRESCLAMGARIHGHRKYAFHFLSGQTLVVDMTLPDETETEVYVEDYDSSVTIKWSPTNHDLRRLVAALGE
jgi:hypothetical protein